MNVLLCFCGFCDASRFPPCGFEDREIGQLYDQCGRRCSNKEDGRFLHIFDEYIKGWLCKCLFEIKTFAGSRAQAKEIVDNWKSYAIQIYPKLIETLTANYAELNPEINTDSFSSENTQNVSNTQNLSEENNISIEDNKPVDGNMNLFDNIK